MTAITTGRAINLISCRKFDVNQWCHPRTTFGKDIFSPIKLMLDTVLIALGDDLIMLNVFIISPEYLL